MCFSYAIWVARGCRGSRGSRRARRAPGQCLRYWKRK